MPVVEIGQRERLLQTIAVIRVTSARLTLLAFQPIHETEYYWYGAPASFEILKDRRIEEAYAALLAALAAHHPPEYA